MKVKLLQTEMNIVQCVWSLSVALDQAASLLLVITPFTYNVSPNWRDLPVLYAGNVRYFHII